MSMEIQNVTYIYGGGTSYEQKALDDISFKINDGEFIGIIGHTGSGKSTLIQLLNGLLKPDAGKILFHNQDIHQPGFSLKQLR